MADLQALAEEAHINFKTKVAYYESGLFSVETWRLQYNLYIGSTFCNVSLCTWAAERSNYTMFFEGARSIVRTQCVPSQLHCEAELSAAHASTITVPPDNSPGPRDAEPEGRAHSPQ